MQDKIIALEIKLAHQEDTLDKLNKALADQQLQIQSLEKRLALLLDLIKETQDIIGSQDGITDHEIPPHY